MLTELWRSEASRGVSAVKLVKLQRGWSGSFDSERFVSGMLKWVVGESQHSSSCHGRSRAWTGAPSSGFKHRTPAAEKQTSELMSDTEGRKNKTPQVVLFWRFCLHPASHKTVWWISCNVLYKYQFSYICIKIIKASVWVSTFCKYLIVRLS